MSTFDPATFPEGETKKKMAAADTAKTQHNGNRHNSGSRTEILIRAERYLAAIPPAVEGNGGNNHTYLACCKLRDFGLSEEEAFSLLRPWNQQCRPPWSDQELQKLIRNAYSYAQLPIGSKLDEPHRTSASTQQKETRPATPKTTSENPDVPQDVENELPGVVRMSDVQPEEVRWLWHPRIPLGKVTLIEGDPGLGKSYVTLAIAAAVSLGLGIPGQPQENPGSVLLLSAEDGLADTVRPRLDAMGADCTKILALNKRVILDEAGCQALDEILAAKKPRLVVIDPLFAYTGAKMDINRANETRDIMTRLAALAEKHGCAIVCIRHLTKGGRDKSIYRGIGSIDLTAACRSVLLVGADANDKSRRAIVQIKNNLAPLAEPIGYSLDKGQFAWTGVSDLTADRILANEQTADDALPLDEAVQFLEELLSGPMNQRDVKKAAQKAGIAERTLYRAKQKLCIKSEKIGFGSEGGWAWRLPQ